MDDGASVLVLASKNRRIEVVSKLIAKGAKIDLQMDDGVFALFIGGQNGHIEVVRELLAKGAKIDKG